MSAAPIRAAQSARSATSTSNFGSSRRESHDASAFYDRFTPPQTSSDSTINEVAESGRIYCDDARRMDAVPDNSVALVVTSPPYFAGKQYEQSLGVDGVPATYFEYLGMLRDVFSECERVLEPGGRIAVNVANLGRRPYRSLSADVTGILEKLGLLLRGEVVWWKGRAAGGSCAWGTFQSPANPVLRDVTERVVIASKGRFDRALSASVRADLNLPSEPRISREEFMEATTDLWELAPESATRVGHPAPFPVQLPQRLIELYTFLDDVILDPFMGSGTSAVAAVRTGRRFIGFDTDPSYILTAEERIEQERLRVSERAASQTSSFCVDLPAVEPGPDGEDFQARAVREGRQAKDLARMLVEGCGFTDIRENVKPRGTGIVLNLVATDHHGDDWAFDVSGAFTSSRAGLKRTDTLWKSLGTAGVLHQTALDIPLVLLTTDGPPKGSSGFKALQTMRGPAKPVRDVIELLNPDDQARLNDYALKGRAFVAPIGKTVER